MDELAIFTRALDIESPAERAAFLQQACGPDSALRARVEALLQSHQAAGSFLQDSPVANSPPTVDAIPTERPDTQVGPYKLIEQIGEGGMGTVWMAQQSEPVRRLVAVKLIKAGMDSRQVIARFEAERQALALMDHPNIARVLDGGTTSAGRPYFVMDLVRGVPITRYCDEHHLTPRQRLELFLPVCQAVQHAHQKGIIHRDLKPSNVLVALYDGKPIPKVIDFGVAKAAGQPLTEQTLVTGFGNIVGTLEYMSPEQAELNQLDIDTRSDIYSLGVLLYELLAGSPPFSRKELEQAGMLEMLRVIREQEPSKPSTKLSTAEGLPTLAANRGTEPAKLTKLVRGDLDWIVMKALEKDRNRRYETANGFAMDVQRYLADEPVLACPPTVAYRLRKYARKHAVALTATSAVAAALLIGTAVSTWQAIRATNAEARAEGDRDAAVASARETADERDKTKEAYAKLERTQEERRADQFAWDMQTIPIAWGAGNADLAWRLLERQPLNLRGFAWHYWDRQTHAEFGTFKLKGTDTPATAGSGSLSLHDWVFNADCTRVARVLAAWTNEDPRGVLVHVWDLAGPKEVRTHTMAVAATVAADWGERSFRNATASFSGDGKRLLLCDSVPEQGGPPSRSLNRATLTRRFQVLDVDTGRVLLDSETLKGRGFVFVGQKLSLDGRKLITTVRVPAPKAGDPAESAIKVWDVGMPEKEPATLAATTVFGSSADGSRVAGLRRRDGRTQTFVWDLAAGKELASWDEELHLCFRPDGKILAGVRVPNAPGAESSVTVRTFEADTGKELMSLPITLPMPPALNTPFVPRPPVGVPLFFSPDGSRLAIRDGRWVSRGGQIAGSWMIIDPQAGKLLFSLDDTAPFNGVPLFEREPTARFTPDGKQFLLIEGNVIRSFDTSSGGPLRSLRGHIESVSSLAVELDTHRLWSVGQDSLKVWDLRSVEPWARIPTPGAIRTPGWTFSFALSADGDRVAWWDPDNRSVQVCDTAGQNRATLEARRREFEFEVPTRDMWLTFSGGGRRVALFRGQRTRTGLDAPGPGKADDPGKLVAPADLTVWEVATGRELFYAQIANAFAPWSVRPFAFSHDGSRLALVERDGGSTEARRLKVIDVDSGRERQSIPLAGSPTNLSISPDGRRVACVENAGNAKAGATTPSRAYRLTVWNVDDGQPMFSPKEVRNAPAITFWSPDGARLAGAIPGPNGGISVYDAATGNRTAVLDATELHASIRLAVHGPVFSPDGRLIAGYVGPVVKVWDAGSGKELLSLEPSSYSGSRPPPGQIAGSRLAFSGDGRRLMLAAPIGIMDQAKGGTPAVAIYLVTWDGSPRQAEPPRENK